LPLADVAHRLLLAVDEHPPRDDDEPGGVQLALLENNLPGLEILAVAGAEKIEQFLFAQAGEELVVLPQLRGENVEGEVPLLVLLG
tara:strand:+ start:315 stop:572 length:258 start_codon:yes stop_codon:yes gene_type:complete